MIDHEQPINTLSPSIFDGHHSIKKLFLIGGAKTVLHNRIFKPIHATLNLVSLELEQSNCNLNDLFNYEREWPVTSLTVTAVGEMPHFNILTPANFSSLPNLLFLGLSDCGIEAILEHTFDKVGNSLHQLHIESNRITAIDSQIFNRIIDKSRKQTLIISTTENPFEANCNCDLLEIIGVMRVNSPTDLFTLIDDYVCVRAIRYYDTATCGRRLQQITKGHLHLSKYPFTNTHYPMFELRLNKSSMTIRIESTKRRAFRLFVTNLMIEWNLSNAHCPNKNETHNSIRCHRFDAQTVDEAVRRIVPPYRFAHICVSYVALGVKKVWPLHCITLYQPPVQLPQYPILLIGIAACFVGLGFSLVLVRPILSLCKMYMGTRCDDDGHASQSTQKELTPSWSMEYNSNANVRNERDTDHYYEDIDYESVHDFYITVIE